MDNDSQVLLTINLEKDTALVVTKGNKRPISSVTKSTVMSDAFVSNALSNEGFRSSGIRQHQWKRMMKGQRLDKMIRTIVADELNVHVNSLVNNVNYKWELID